MMDYKEYKMCLRQKRLTTINGAAMNYLKGKRQIRIQKKKGVKLTKEQVVN